MPEIEADWLYSGERLVPSEAGGPIIEAEHLARYRLALPHLAGRDVLDAGCGVGWGSQLMLTEGKAASVIGVDIFPPAIGYAKEHYSGPTYWVGDMVSVTLPDDSVDVVVCFEALEHVHDHEAVLAEFARVIRPGGWLFVSSPNPDVYPGGNPFHIHELKPEDLLTAVGSVFARQRSLAQELLVASLLTDATAELTQLDSVRLSPAAAGTDQYSVVVASDGPLPELSGILVLAGADQLTELDTLSQELARDRAAFNQQAEATAAENARLHDAARRSGEHAVALEARIDKLNQQLAEAGHSLASVMTERDDLVARITTAEQRAPDPKLTAELNLARTERDRAIVDLLHTEQALARAVSADNASETSAWSASAARLAVELTALQHTTSWRVTAPLRRLRHLQLRWIRRLADQ